MNRALLSGRVMYAAGATAGLLLMHGDVLDRAGPALWDVRVLGLLFVWWLNQALWLWLLLAALVSVIVDLTRASIVAAAGGKR